MSHGGFGHHGGQHHHVGHHGGHGAAQALNAVYLMALLQGVCASIFGKKKSPEPAGNEKEVQEWEKAMQAQTLKHRLLHMDLTPFIVLPVFVVLLISWLSAIYWLNHLDTQKRAKSSQASEVNRVSVPAYPAAAAFGSTTNQETFGAGTAASARFGNPYGQSVNASPYYSSAGYPTAASYSGDYASYAPAAAPSNENPPARQRIVVDR